MVDLLTCLCGWKATRCDEMRIDQSWEIIQYIEEVVEVNPSPEGRIIGCALGWKEGCALGRLLG